ncbi:hypothetical protein [[Eubacterium] cellulosolvens]
MKIPIEVINFIEERKIGRFGTIGYLAIVFDDKGTKKPLVSPRHFRLYGEDCLIFDDRFSEYLKQNLDKHREVSVIFVETLRDTFGYQILGEAEYIDSGDLFDDAHNVMKEMKIPHKLKGIVKIKVNKIVDLTLGEQKTN